MVIDNNLVLSSSQGLTTSALTDKSVDLGSAIDIGKGKQLYMVFQIITSVAAGNSGDNVIFEVRTSTTENLATSPTTILQTTGLLGSVLTAGREPIIIPIPMGISQQFIGGYYTLSTTFTSFDVDAYITFEYPSNFGN